MHNGCLLLIAFVAVFQPIASYTERGLVDGRQQRCDYRTSIRDPGLNFHGTSRFAKPVVEERRLNHREEIRDYRRNEVREDSLRIASSADRRHAERDRNTLKSPSRNRISNDAVLRRETREARVSDYRDERIQDIRRERLARVQEPHQARSPIRRENTRLSEDVNRIRRIDNRPLNERRVSVELRTAQRFGKNAETRRVQENRDMHVTTNRVRDNVISSLNGRRLSRERVQRMDTQRSAPRIQLDRNAEREVLDRRSRDRELRSSSTYSFRVNRAYGNEDSRIDSRVETTSLDREDRRISSSRRSVDERRHQLRYISRNRLATERRYNREPASSRNVRELLSEARREAQSVQRARSTESRRETRENESNRLVRDVRSVDYRVSQNDRIDSRISERERSTENQRNLRDTQSMERIRSVEGRTESRKSSRSVDRVRALEGRSIRNIERESRIRTAETRKSIRNVERYSRELLNTAEVRRETRNRNTCAFDRERSTEHQMTREQPQENRIDARNIDSRSFSIERADQSRRDARSYAGSRVFRSERIDGRILESRPFTAERVERLGRDVRNADSRRFRTERTDSNRRNIKDINEQSRSLRRVIDNRRVSRNNERDARIQDRTLESRRNIRNTESRTESELAFRNRRVTRSLNGESRSMSRERSIENRLNERMVARDARVFKLERRSENRRERATENRLDSHNNRKELRTLESQDRRVGPSGINLVRTLDALTQRKNERTTERLSKRETLQNSHNLQRESRDKDTRRISEKDDLAVRRRDTESLSALSISRKREFQSVFRNAEHQAENETTTKNWQYIFYTVQTLYIWGVLRQLNKGSVGKKTRTSWWSTPQHLIKVE